MTRGLSIRNSRGAVPPRGRARVGLLAAGFLAGMLLPALAGCGTEPGGAGAQPPALSEEASCEGLQIRDPRSGGNLSCLACRHDWRWSVPASSGTLRFLIELTCASTPGARLSITGPDRRILWGEDIHSGQRERFCVPVREPREGLYTVSLGGDLPLGLTHFTGSIWMNLAGPGGETLPPRLPASP